MSNSIIKSDAIIQKLLLIDKLNICDDLLPIIKDYLFYDETTVRQRILHRSLYAESLKEITWSFSITRRMMSRSDYDKYNNNSKSDIFNKDTPVYAYQKHVSITFSTIHMYGPELNLTICATCGNFRSMKHTLPCESYIEKYDVEASSEHAKCRCVFPNDLFVFGYEDLDDRDDDYCDLLSTFNRNEIYSDEIYSY